MTFNLETLQFEGEPVLAGAVKMRAWSLSESHDRLYMANEEVIFAQAADRILCRDLLAQDTCGQVRFGEDRPYTLRSLAYSSAEGTLAAGLPRGQIQLYRQANTSQWSTVSQTLQLPLLSLDASDLNWLGWYQGRLYAIDRTAGRIYLSRKQGSSFAAPVLATLMLTHEKPHDMAFHPTLPVAYTVNSGSLTAMVLKVRPDGTLERFTQHTLRRDGFFQNSNFPVDTYITVAKNGRTAYAVSAEQGGILIMNLDAQGLVASTQWMSSRAAAPGQPFLYDEAGLMFVPSYNGGSGQDFVSVYRVLPSGQLQHFLDQPVTNNAFRIIGSDKVSFIQP